MITIKKGDLIKDGCKECDMILHQVNCQGVMGSGVAKQIKKTFPETYEIYKEFLDKYGKNWCFGNYTISHCDYENNKVSVVNLFGQMKYGYDGYLYTNYEKLENAIEELWYGKIFYLAGDNQKNYKIGIPYKMGCDRGGGNWEKVLGIIEKYLGRNNVIIYKLED